MTDKEVINNLNKMLQKATKIIEKYEKATAEIEAKAKEHEFYLDMGHPHDGLYEALEIINRHTRRNKMAKTKENDRCANKLVPTNGDMIKALFCHDEEYESIRNIICNVTYLREWWHAPYKEDKNG